MNEWIGQPPARETGRTTTPSKGYVLPGCHLEVNATCVFCGRPGKLVTCCDHHPDDLVCVDTADCRDFMLAQLKTPSRTYVEAMDDLREQHRA